MAASLSLSLPVQTEAMLANVGRLKEERGGEERMFGLRQAVSQALDLAEKATDDYHIASKVCSSVLVCFILWNCFILWYCVWYCYRWVLLFLC